MTIGLTGGLDSEVSIGVFVAGCVSNIKATAKAKDNLDPFIFIF